MQLENTRRVPFWDCLEAHGHEPCLVDGIQNVSLSYRELAARANQVAESIYARPQKALVLLAAGLDIGGVVHLIAALRAGHAVQLVKTHLPSAQLALLKERYRPEFVTVPVSSDAGTWGYETFLAAGEGFINSDLAILLSTSGSSGSPKCVRLSKTNVMVSAEQIRHALKIDGAARSLLNLPLSYVYGLSVLNSQLSAGGCVILDRRSYIDPSLWSDVAHRGITELHGVPASYDLLRKAAQKGLLVPRLAAVTQSGGALSANVVDWMVQNFAAKSVDVFKMYGLTEASSRVSVLPPDRFFEKSSSVGQVVHGGNLLFDSEGELIYSGSNVMMGYAHSTEDLGEGDLIGGVLATGDTGYIDGEGFLYLTGRRDRTVKVNGLRFNLDEVEQRLARRGPLAAVACKDGLKIIHDCADSLAEQYIRQTMMSFGVPPNLVLVKGVVELPRLANGKIDYALIRDL